MKSRYSDDRKDNFPNDAERWNTLPADLQSE
jgi:hypothetical protein